MSENESGLEAPAVALLAHDSRAYVRQIVITGQLLLRGETLSAEASAGLRRMIDSAKELDSMMTATVNYGCLAEAPEAFRVAARLTTLVQGAVIEMKPRIEEAGGALAIGEIPPVRVASGLQWVLRELLQNSLRFRGSRPLTVSVEFASNGQTLSARVTDNGRGIPEKYQSEVFLPFKRLHGRDAFPGHGLGLPTAARIAQVCGGTVGLRPREEGTQVEIAWPLLG